MFVSIEYLRHFNFFKGLTLKFYHFEKLYKYFVDEKCPWVDFDPKIKLMQKPQNFV